MIKLISRKWSAGKSKWKYKWGIAYISWLSPTVIILSSYGHTPTGLLLPSCNCVVLSYPVLYLYQRIRQWTVVITATWSPGLSSALIKSCANMWIFFFCFWITVFSSHCQQLYKITRLCNAQWNVIALATLPSNLLEDQLCRLVADLIGSF